MQIALVTVGMAEESAAYTLSKPWTAIVVGSTTACFPVPIAHVPAGCHSVPAFDRTHESRASSVHDAGSIGAAVTADKALESKMRLTR